MNKQKAWKITAYALAGTVLAGALVFYNFIEKADVGAQVNEICPLFTVDAVYKSVDAPNGKQFAIDETRTFVMEECLGKVVVLNFWAPWCNPCCEEIPHFNELQERYENDVEVVVINDGGESPQELLLNNLNNPSDIHYEANYSQWLEYSFTFVCPQAGTSVKSLFDGGDGLPVTVIVDRTGTIKQIYRVPLDYATLETEVLKYI